MGSCCSQDGVYDVSTWEENDKMGSTNISNLDKSNDSVRSGQASVTSNTFSTPSTASLQLLTTNRHLQPPAWIFSGKSQKLTARRRQIDWATTSDEMSSGGSNNRISASLKSSSESSMVEAGENETDSVPGEAVLRFKRGSRVSPVMSGQLLTSSNVPPIIQSSSSPTFENFVVPSLLLSSPSTSRSKLNQDCFDEFDFPFSSRSDRPVTPAKSILKSSKVAKGNNSDLSPTGGGGGGAGCRKQPQHEIQHTKVQNFLSTSRSTAEAVLENLTEATLNFFNPYRDKRSVARKKVLNRVDRWWEEESIQDGPSYHFNEDSMRRRVSAPPARRIVHFDFEQPIYNPWMHHRISEDDPHAVVLTTASSNHDTPSMSFEGSGNPQHDDDDDLEIQDWYDPETPPSDTAEDEQDQMERQVQWQRAHRFLSVIAKWKRSGQTPRAFSDPELFGHCNFPDSEKRHPRKETMTLI